ncbi:hypothetical protein [Nostoc sp. NMS4]|uniref:hypothetical protein n=1 Tax=Nostoc sp. NMS4 TaxID=2815390 RepID=UPI0025FFC0AE|nr:hypothetical protein [Nostoc sp. NMS4]MBN3925339.1 hypothetical protein [Nostoc sp. NMS4]
MPVRRAEFNSRAGIIEPPLNSCLNSTPLFKLITPTTTSNRCPNQQSKLHNGRAHRTQIAFETQSTILNSSGAARLLGIFR